MKIAALLPFKNELENLELYFDGVSKIADEVIGYDDSSTDGSREKFLNLGGKLIKTNFSDSFVNGKEKLVRTKLLNSGRESNSTHFILLDADEILYYREKDYLMEFIKQLKPGQKLALDWVNLWGSYSQFCTEGKPWEPRQKAFIFMDHKKINYMRRSFRSSIFHFDRIPSFRNAPKWISGDITDFAVIHTQFANLEKAQIKQIWYKMVELINRPKSEKLINSKYKDSVSPKVVTSKIPDEWKRLLGGAPKNYSLSTDWRYLQIVNLFDEFGMDFFKNLDIWQVNEMKALLDRKLNI